MSWTSAINPAWPVEGNPTTASVRENFQTTKDELEGIATDLATDYLPLAGGVMLGDITLARDPTAALHATTKEYTDWLIAPPNAAAGSGAAGRSVAIRASNGNGAGDGGYVTIYAGSPGTSAGAYAGWVNLVAGYAAPSLDTPKDGGGVSLSGGRGNTGPAGGNGGPVNIISGEGWQSGFKSGDIQLTLHAPSDGAKPGNLLFNSLPAADPLVHWGVWQDTAGFVHLSTGAAQTHPLPLFANPVGPMDAASKQYADWLLAPPNATVGNTDGSGVNITASAGNGTGLGGAVIIRGGQAGTGVTSGTAAGSVSVIGGQGRVGGRTGGAVTLVGGTAYNAGGDGGNVYIQGGRAYQAGYVGGDVQIQAGPYSSPATAGYIKLQLLPTANPLVDTAVWEDAAGFLHLSNGAAETKPLPLFADPVGPLDAATRRYVDTTAGNFLPLSGGVLTGPLSIADGTHSVKYSFSGTDFYMQAADALAGSGADGTRVYIIGGAADGNGQGGGVLIYGASGGKTGTASYTNGYIQIRAAQAYGPAPGGAVTILSGNGLGSGAGSSGGDMTLGAGAGYGSGKKGGDVYIYPGSGSSSAVNGSLFLYYLPTVDPLIANAVWADANYPGTLKLSTGSALTGAITIRPATPSGNLAGANITIQAAGGSGSGAAGAVNIQGGTPGISAGTSATGGQVSLTGGTGNNTGQRGGTALVVGGIGWGPGAGANGGIAQIQGGTGYGAGNFGGDVRIIPGSGSSSALPGYVKVYPLPTTDPLVNSAMWQDTAGFVHLSSGAAQTHPLPLFADPVGPLDAATKQYVDAGDAKSLPLAGGTLIGALNLAADPVGNLEASTKQYVDVGLAKYLPLTGGTLSDPLTVNSTSSDTATALTVNGVANITGGVAPAGNTYGLFSVIRGQPGGGSRDGGDVQLYGGVGGPTGPGGSVRIYAGNGGSTSGQSGTVVISAGTGNGSSKGGNVSITAGAAQPNASAGQTGGDVTITSGAGNASATSSSTGGGTLALRGGNAAGAAGSYSVGGSITVQAGNAGSASNGAGGTTLISGGGGYGTGNGGATTVQGGGANTTGTGGAVTIQGGGSVGNVSGSVTIQPGSANGSTASTGSVTIQGGNAVGGAVAGGALQILLTRFAQGLQIKGLPTADPAISGAVWVDVAAGRVLKVSA